jgi:hypothetical protein
MIYRKHIGIRLRHEGRERRKAGETFRDDVYVITATPKKLWGEAPWQQLPPVVGGFCRGSFPEYPGQILEGFQPLTFAVSIGICNPSHF